MQLFRAWLPSFRVYVQPDWCQVIFLLFGFRVAQRLGLLPPRSHTRVMERLKNLTRDMIFPSDDRHHRSWNDHWDEFTDVGMMYVSTQDNDGRVIRTGKARAGLKMVARISDQVSLEALLHFFVMAKPPDVSKPQLIVCGILIQ